ncbi:MAG: hypothetical protein AB7I30_21980, partial [Isosphaeraceae bacterium]
MSETSQGSQNGPDQIVKDFDRDWSAGRRPSLKNALERVNGPGREHLISELFRLEIRHRLRLREKP